MDSSQQSARYALPYWNKHVCECECVCVCMCVQRTSFNFPQVKPSALITAFLFCEYILVQNKLSPPVAHAGILGLSPAIQSDISLFILSSACGLPSPFRCSGVRPPCTNTVSPTTKIERHSLAKRLRASAPPRRRARYLDAAHAGTRLSSMLAEHSLSDSKHANFSAEYFILHTCSAFSKDTCTGHRTHAHYVAVCHLWEKVRGRAGGGMRFFLVMCLRMCVCMFDSNQAKLFELVSRSVCTCVCMYEHLGKRTSLSCV